MNKIIYILLILIPNIVFSQINQDLIGYNNSINKDSLEKTVLSLQNYGTRFCFKPNRKDIAQDLKNQLQSYGLDAKLDSFYIQDFEFPFHSGVLNSGWQYNIVGEIKGILAPDTFFVVGAHYDAISFTHEQGLPAFDQAPGADDNGSGVAAVMEIARLYQKHNIIPIKTLRLELYAAEEIGIKGSFYAIETSHYKLTEHIAGMMCLDMIGHKFDSLDQDIIQLIEYDNSQELTDFCEQTTNLYTTLTPFVNSNSYEYSDSYSYYQWGRKAIFLHEGNFSPFYHSPQDLSSNLDYNYLSKVAQLAFSITYLATVTNDYYPVTNPELIIQDKNEFSLLSNPIKDNIEFIYVSNTNNDPGFQLINQMGIIVKKSKLSSYRINSSEYKIPVYNLNSGLYFLKIQDQTRKIIIGHF